MSDKVVWVPLTIIVPLSYADFARDLCACLAGPAGAGMFTASIGVGNIETHRISGQGLIDEQFAGLLPLTEYPADADPIHTPGQPATVAALATAQGMAVTTEQVAALFAAATVTTETGLAAMARLGLSAITPHETP